MPVITPAPIDERDAHRTMMRTATRALAVVAGVVLVGAIDYATGVEVRVYPLYYLPIGFAAWHFGRATTVGAALLATGVWVAANLLGGMHFSSPWIWVFNAAAQAVSFSVVGVLIAVLHQRLRWERELAGVDTLTSLMNRRAFYRTGERVLERCRRMRKSVTLAYIDLDDFKLVNDRAGHLAGDLLLQEVADVIRLAVRPTDLIARFGGDEFVILLPEVSAHDAGVVLERVRASLHAERASTPHAVTATIGAAAFGTIPTLDIMIRSADSAMYTAKRAGRDRVNIEIVHAAGI